MKKHIQKLVNRLGYRIINLKKYEDKPGTNPFRDMATLVRTTRSPMIFDVGANVGQTASACVNNFPGAVIHSFEPSPGTFAELDANCKGFKNQHSWNFALGSKEETLEFKENSFSEMSSLLKETNLTWGEVINIRKVPVKTINGFVAEHKIRNVDILKTDTQGFDLEVFKGASDLFRQNRVHLVYFEFTFMHLYEGLPSFSSMMAFMEENGFSLKGIYDPHYRGGMLGWADFLFVNKNYERVE